MSLADWLGVIGGIGVLILTAWKTVISRRQTRLGSDQGDLNRRLLEIEEAREADRVTTGQRAEIGATLRHRSSRVPGIPPRLSESPQAGGLSCVWPYRVLLGCRLEFERA